MSALDSNNYTIIYFDSNIGVVEVNVKVESAGTCNVHNNDFYAKEKLLKSMRDCDPSSVRHWILWQWKFQAPLQHYTTLMDLQK